MLALASLNFHGSNWPNTGRNWTRDALRWDTFAVWSWPQFDGIFHIWKPHLSCNSVARRLAKWCAVIAFDGCDMIHHKNKDFIKKEAWMAYLPINTAILVAFIKKLLHQPVCCIDTKLYNKHYHCMRLRTPIKPTDTRRFFLELSTPKQLHSEALGAHFMDAKPSHQGRSCLYLCASNACQVYQKATMPFDPNSPLC